MLVAASYLVTYALLCAVLFRLSCRLLRAGWHSDEGAVGWALWFSGALMTAARGVLFPLYATIYTRGWLRLLGVSVGKRTEVANTGGLSRFTRLGSASFLTDDILFAAGRARNGWLHLGPITVGSRAFVGNGALVSGTATVGDDSLVGVLTAAPQEVLDGTSWFGLPAMELPRVPERPDPSRTTDPPRRLVVARGAVELVKILLPSTVTVMLGALVLLALETLGTVGGAAWLMVLCAPFVLLAAGLAALAVTVAAKWLLMGRYRPSENPLWSSFVWRDEVINSLQEQVASVWLLGPALATPVVSMYLRAMGAEVGRDVWCETLAITEFDLVHLRDGCAVNRGSCIQTHLFHDRLMRNGPAILGPGSTLGPTSFVLPDATLGAACSVGAHSVVMRGEELPPHTSWHGAPVVSR